MGTDKSAFLRERIHDKNMRVVIVRLDFAGISDLNDLIKTFDKGFPSTFKRKCVMENREVNVSFREKDFESISKSLSIPVEAIKSERFVRYEKIEGCNCDVSFDISQFYLCMTIKCQNNYDGLTNYVAPLKGAIKLFKDKFNYFSPKRLGIRKVRVQTENSLKEFQDIFEPFIIEPHNFNINQPRLRKSESIDVIEDAEKKLRFNIRREIASVLDKEKAAQITVTLDIDAYYHEEALEKGKINDMLSFANQKEFEIYKNCMKSDYLSRICY